MPLAAPQAHVTPRPGEHRCEAHRADATPAPSRKDQESRRTLWPGCKAGPCTPAPPEDARRSFLVHRSPIRFPEIALLDRIAPFRARIAVSLAGTAALAILVATPQLLGSRLGPALDGLSGAAPAWLWAAGLGFALSLVASALAWRTATYACGGRLSRSDAVARYVVGSLVNSLAPAKLGDAVRIGLFARSIDCPQRIWKAGSIYAALAAARCLVLAGLIVASAVTGALPLWPVFALFAVAGLLIGLAFLARNDERHRFARLFDALATLQRSPRAAAKLFLWVVASTLAKVAAAGAIAVAFGVSHPLLAALVIVPALDLAGLFPLTPGNVGLASGAVTLALQARGIRMTEALTAGIALHAVEMLVGLGLGAAGSLYLVRAKAPWTLRVAAAAATVLMATAFGATVLSDLV
jgi:uncharacterized membrane protein YbhN (UPF0104 family)